MPRPPKYPLKALLEHRDRAVDAATAELGGAVRARESAAAARERAAEERKRAEDAADAERAAEQARLELGGLRVEDLARAGAWEVGVRHRLSDLERAEARAGDALASARSAEDAARDGLAEKKAGRDVVAKDEARFRDRTRRESEAAAEDEADDAWQGRRGPR